MDFERPIDILNVARKKSVVVELKNKTQITGILEAFDIHPNIVLSNAEESEGGEVKRKIGNVFIRGDMVILISPA